VLSWFESLVDPYPQAAELEVPRGFFAFLWYCARGMRRYVLVMALLTALIGAYEAVLFSMLGHMVDWLAHVAPSALFTQERSHLLILGAILLISPVVIALQTLVKHQTLASNFPMRLRWRFHSAMLNQSMSFYQDEFAGRVATKVMQTALAVRDTWFVLSDILIYVGVYFITIAGVAASFNIWLILPFLVWVSLYTIAMRYFVPRLSKVAKSQADARSLMTGRITDAYTNISTVKLFSHGRREASYAREAMQEFMQTARGQMRLVTGFEICNHLMSVMLIGSTAGLALWLWTEGRIGVGSVAAATAMALRLNGISQWVMWEFASLFEYVGTVQDGINTLGRPHAVTDRQGASALVVEHGDVRFQNVTFAYGGASPVIENLNLHIRAGEKIGLVGRSGAGKSTIVNLLLRFYDVQSGQILIDGIDIASTRQDSLRSQIGMVTQDTSLLHRSVRDNIKYGRPEASEEEMQRAARLAEADAFVDGLADAAGRRGYDAHVGERGVKLSGGQRQRIAIARVMLKDAPILLLDEATSALDSEVEVAIQGSLGRLMQGKTVVAIAHRLSTIAAMDRLIVLDRGRIVEEGDHQSLLAQGGLYARLWAHQSGGFLVEDDELDLVDGTVTVNAD
jgi:ATP-binding cassette subfamily B multidrug efflux pump